MWDRRECIEKVRYQFLGDFRDFSLILKLDMRSWYVRLAKGGSMSNNELILMVKCEDDRF